MNIKLAFNERSEYKMIGLDIRVKNKYSNYLYQIFRGIDYLKYIWEINFDDFLYLEEEYERQDFFKAPILNGEEFFKCISRDKYYMIFADIKAYLGDNHIEIKTFEDFLKSNCEIVLLCTDSIYIEFYCKDRKILDKVYNNCTGIDFEKVEYKRAEDVAGRCFIAW